MAYSNTRPAFAQRNSAKSKKLSQYSQSPEIQINISQTQSLQFHKLLTFLTTYHLSSFASSFAELTRPCTKTTLHSITTFSTHHTVK
jgi:hypothetical protein